MSSKAVSIIAVFIAFIMALSLGLTAIGLGVNYNSSQKIQTLLTTGKTASAITAKETLTDEQHSLELFSAIEEELGTIIIANHFKLSGEQVQCTANPTKFTVSCKIVATTTTTTTTLPKN